MVNSIWYLWYAASHLILIFSLGCKNFVNDTLIYLPFKNFQSHIIDRFQKDYSLKNDLERSVKCCSYFKVILALENPVPSIFLGKY